MYRLTSAAMLFLAITLPTQAHGGNNGVENIVVPAVYAVLDEAATSYEPVHYRSYRHRRYRNAYHRHSRGYYRYGHRHSYRSPYHRHHRRNYYNYRRYY